MAHNVWTVEVTVYAPENATRKDVTTMIESLICEDVQSLEIIAESEFYVGRAFKKQS